MHLHHDIDISCSSVISKETESSISWTQHGCMSDSCTFFQFGLCRDTYKVHANEMLYVLVHAAVSNKTIEYNE